MSLPAHPANAPIPTKHERLSTEQVERFAGWMDAQIRRLEVQFAEFVTATSIRTGTQSERHTQASWLGHERADES